VHRKKHKGNKTKELNAQESNIQWMKIYKVYRKMSIFFFYVEAQVGNIGFV
jgi:hypothetical protein